MLKLYCFKNFKYFLTRCGTSHKCEKNKKIKYFDNFLQSKVNSLRMTLAILSNTNKNVIYIMVHWCVSINFKAVLESGKLKKWDIVYLKKNERSHQLLNVIEL